MKVLDDTTVKGKLQADNLSYIGMIIHSATLDTKEKVKAMYGGNDWVQISGMMLIGAGSTYSAGSTGGTNSATITASNIPAHTHSIPAATVTTSSGGGHSHPGTAHTHSYTASVNTTGNHTHQEGSVASSLKSGSSLSRMVSASSASEYGWTTSSTGAHTHSVTITTGNPSSLTTTNGTAASHGQTSVAASTTGNNSTTGTAVSVLNPYKVVYIWERIS